MYIVTTEQMQAAEKAADAAELSYDQMMENAGRAVAEAIETQFDIDEARVVILVGPGNNGGDGLVVARHLSHMGAVVTVYIWKRNTEGDKNWQLLDETMVERVFRKEDSDQEQAQLTGLLYEADIIVDALLGTGVSRPIEGTLAKLLDQAKTVVSFRRSPQDDYLVAPAQPPLETEVGPLVVALDVPSGLNSDTGQVDPHTLKADLTVTLAAVKQGHILMPGPEVVGQLIVGDIKITAEHYPEGIDLEMATPAKVAAMLPARPAGAHKGTFGTALIVAGSINYTGAAILAGQAATRIGTGLVTLAPPLAIHPILASRLTEATYLPLPDIDGALGPDGVRPLKERLAQGVEALLVGPGLGQANPTEDFLLELLSGKASGKRGSLGFRRSEAGDSGGTEADLPPLILDADALNILARQEAWWQLLPPNCILTPHPGEMARLVGGETTVKDVEASRLEIAAEMAATWNQIVLLKGAHTIVAAPDGRRMVMPFANPALAKAGSGDVLAGSIVGLRAQGLEPFEAAVAGAYLHGLAGELARDSIGATAAVAGDLVGFLMMAVQELIAGD